MPISSVFNVSQQIASNKFLDGFFHAMFHILVRNDINLDEFYFNAAFAAGGR